MSMTLINEKIKVKHTPDIPGLIFRGFRGDEDFPKMLAVIEGSKDADGIERSDTLEDITNTRRIDGVMVRGRWYTRADLDVMLEAVAKAHRYVERCFPPPQPEWPDNPENLGKMDDNFNRI